MRHNGRICRPSILNGLYIITFFWLACSQGGLDSDGAQALLQCYNDGPDAPPGTFAAFLLKGSAPGSLVLHRVLWSSKAASLPLTVLAGLTPSRLDALRAQCASWAGPLAVAVYVALPAEPGTAAAGPTHPLLTRAATEQLAVAEAAVQALFASSEGSTGGCQLRMLLLYELVGDPHIGALLPINHLRNAALLAASTPLVAMIDVDLLISATLAQQLADAARAEATRRACSDAPRSVLILPAFETAKSLTLEDGGRLATAVAQGTKQALAPFLTSRQLHAFALHVYARGHNATDYPQWLAATAPYRISYQVNYEPWFVIDRATSPPYDVRFRGYGWNKVAQVALVNTLGFQLLVHPTAFLVHRPHGRSDAQSVYSGAAAGGRGAATAAAAGAAEAAAGRKTQAPAQTAARAEAASRGKLFHRKVAALRHVVLRDLKRGTYEPVVDEASLRCREALPWWRTDTSAAEGGRTAGEAGGLIGSAA